MQKTTGMLIAILATFSATSASAQTDIWDGLARTTFDTSTATLRIPCAVVKDGTGKTIPGFAPAFAMNLQLAGNALRLVDPIKAFEEVPESCLDNLVVDGNIATYSTQSAESNSTAAEFSNRLYTLALQATLPSNGPIEFTVLSSEERFYIRPFYEGEAFAFSAGASRYPRDFTYDDSQVNEALRLLLLGLTVSEHGRIDTQCAYKDPLGLLEVVGNVDGNTQYRIKSSLTAADNGKIFSIECTAFNRDINRLDLAFPLVEWIINLP